MTYLAMENRHDQLTIHMHAQIIRVGGVLEVKVVVKEKLDALEGGVQHI